MKITRQFILSACLAVAAMGVFAGAGAACVGLAAFGATFAALFAPAPLHLLASHPRSIFETRRAGLA